MVRKAGEQWHGIHGFAGPVALFSALGTRILDAKPNKAGSPLSYTNSEFDLTLSGLGALDALPVAQLHHQQRRAEEERDSIRQDDGQRVDHEAVAYPQQEPHVEANQHEQREIADGLATKGVQGLRKVRQRAQRARGKAG